MSDQTPPRATTNEEPNRGGGISRGVGGAEESLGGMETSRGPGQPPHNFRTFKLYPGGFWNTEEVNSHPWEGGWLVPQSAPHRGCAVTVWPGYRSPRPGTYALAPGCLSDFCFFPLDVALRPFF